MDERQNKSMETAALEDLGLSQAEIKIYIALLDIGESTTGPIIEQCKLQSSVVHRVIKQLIEKELVSYVVVGKNKLYQPAKPQNLVNFVETKKKRLLEILPELESRQQLVKRNTAEMFMGHTAVFALLSSISKQKDVSVYINTLTPEKDFLISKKHSVWIHHPGHKSHNTGFIFPHDILITKNQIVYVHWDEIVMATQITNESAARQHKTFFEQINKLYKTK
jgi:predicted transcriptional regulator